MSAEQALPPAEPSRPVRKRRVRTGLTVERFRALEAELRARGYGDMIEWSENIMPPTNCGAFAKEVIYVICNSGMKFLVANMIYWRCIRALRVGRSATEVFGHPGKAKAIDHVWQHRKILFEAFKVAENKPAFCRSLPFVGPITVDHLLKNFGMGGVKPDVHLERLAHPERITPLALCERLSNQTGYRLSTIDSILWRACADEILNSWTYMTESWENAFAAPPFIKRLSAEPNEDIVNS